MPALGAHQQLRRDPRALHAIDGRGPVRVATPLADVMKDTGERSAPKVISRSEVDAKVKHERQQRRPVVEAVKLGGNRQPRLFEFVDSVHICTRVQQNPCYGYRLHDAAAGHAKQRRFAHPITNTQVSPSCDGIPATSALCALCSGVDVFIPDGRC